MLSDTEFRQLLEHLDRPWAGFRKVRKGVKKRVRRHMASLGCSTFERYLQTLTRRADARATCEQCLRVTISRFFRDEQLWQTLEERILPDLINRHPPPMRIWSAGCACGEEPYSLAMVWAELGRPMALDIVATDTGEDCLDRARAGLFGRSSLKQLPDRLRERYFCPQKGGRQYLIRCHRLPPIRWRQHDLLGPPFEDGRFHLILLRNNLLTYYQGPDRQAAFERVMAALTPGGVLVTGAHEHLPVHTNHLDRDHGCPWIYRYQTSHREK
jgi:chemotaxis methyl-accepting protein methylase